MDVDEFHILESKTAFNIPYVLGPLPRAEKLECQSPPKAAVYHRTEHISFGMIRW